MTVSPNASSSLYLSAKGTGSVQMNTNGALAFSAYTPASSVNYLNSTGATTGNPVTVQPGGSDANIALKVVGKGTSGADGRARLTSFARMAVLPIQYLSARWKMTPRWKITSAVLPHVTRHSRTPCNEAVVITS